VHVHAVIRLDGPDGPESAPTAWATAELLAEAVGRAAARVSVTVEGSSGRELVVRWGEHFERRKASGFRALKVHLTQEARAHAFAGAVPAQFTVSVGYGRGREEWRPHFPPDIRDRSRDLSEGQRGVVSISQDRERPGH